ncbi:hypothetical protein C8R44DRAFT_796430 [Mycena epipterygia]|nr:hypothetical protein C8R44DRAFT_796430 [Mycena epipterygia]
MLYLSFPLVLLLSTIVIMYCYNLFCTLAVARKSTMCPLSSRLACLRLSETSLHAVLVFSPGLIVIHHRHHVLL